MLSDARFFSNLFQFGAGIPARPSLEKLREAPSLRDFGAKCDGVADDTAAFNVAKAITKTLRISADDVCLISGVQLTETDALQCLICEPGSKIKVQASANVIGLDIQRDHFEAVGVLDIESTGTANDGLQTVGIRHGHPTIGGKAFARFEKVKYAGFSGRGMVSFQPVYLQVADIVGTGGSGTDLYGFSVEKANISGIGVVSGTTVKVGAAYISGARRGINLDGAGWVELKMPVLEYCGSSSTNDGALHMVGVATCTVENIYGEQNQRNIVRVDSTAVFIGGAMFAAAAPDVVQYSGMAFDQRGATKIRGNTIATRKITHDTEDGADLTIGENLIVPAAGGSVSLGGMTVNQYSGTLTSNVWTTVATLTTNEVNGANVSDRALFEYYAKAGTADLSTGADAGTIFNGTMRSYSGALPAWLRLNGSNVEMLVNSNSYGLSYELKIRRIK